MSTRARIGLVQEDGSILSAYHHWDGYPEWLGVTLKEHYDTREDWLIDGGNMSSCWSDNEFDYEKQEFVRKTLNQTIMVEKMKDHIIMQVSEIFG